eukprot:1185684-Prorocentrum_minimum.AAC.4
MIHCATRLPIALLAFSIVAGSSQAALRMLYDQPYIFTSNRQRQCRIDASDTCRTCDSSRRIISQGAGVGDAVWTGACSGSPSMPPAERSSCGPSASLASERVLIPHTTSAASAIRSASSIAMFHSPHHHSHHFASCACRLRSSINKGAPRTGRRTYEAEISEFTGQGGQGGEFKDPGGGPQSGRRPTHAGTWVGNDAEFDAGHGNVMQGPHVRHVEKDGGCASAKQ